MENGSINAEIYIGSIYNYHMNNRIKVWKMKFASKPMNVLAISLFISFMSIASYVIILVVKKPAVCYNETFYWYSECTEIYAHFEIWAKYQPQSFEN